MKYPLVLQWSASSREDYDALLAMEEDLTNDLSEIGDVDGHGRFSIPAWRRCRPARSIAAGLRDLRVAASEQGRLRSDPPGGGLFCDLR